MVEGLNDGAADGEIVGRCDGNRDGNRDGLLLGAKTKLMLSHRLNRIEGIKI